MHGAELRMRRLFDADSGRSYVVAIDHGMQFGVQPGSVVRGCPAPVLVLGGAKAESEQALLESTRDALRAGAAGVIYGRNIWQAEDPLRVGRAVRSLVHEKG